MPSKTLQQRLKAVQNIKDVCAVCRSEHAQALIAYNNEWKMYKLPYEQKDITMLCTECKKQYSPFALTALNATVMEIFRSFPLFDERGRVLPPSIVSKFAFFDYAVTVTYASSLYLYGVCTHIVEGDSFCNFTFIPNSGQSLKIDRMLGKWGYIVVVAPTYFGEDTRKISLPTPFQFIPHIIRGVNYSSYKYGDVEPERPLTRV